MADRATVCLRCLRRIWLFGNVIKRDKNVVTK